ncbi:MAG: hypothetical protein K2M76_00820, partial [Muribaculaceae bacterium]|nr:hypothetical protein [Muribaculaceae bacterium]
VFTEGQYPRIKGLDQSQAALYSASARVMNATSSINKLTANAVFNAMGNTDFGYLRNGQIVKQGYYSNVVGDSIILNDTYTVGTDTLFIVNGRAQYHYFVNVAPVPFDGEGTQENPFLIRTKSDLIQLSKITTANKQTFPGTYFRMTNDIDLEYSEDFLGIMCDGSTTAFAGSFDGNGYAIHRMRISQLVWSKEPTASSMGTVSTTGLKSYQGFIGRLAEGGTVSNLTIAADCQFTFHGFSGAVVGYNFGRIENCRNYADITTYTGTYVGGICGYNNNAVTAIIDNCFNAGNITSARYGVGGITGVNYNMVSNCVNTGDITAKVMVTNYNSSANYLVGGISGSMNGRLENCVNYGTVTADNRVGGLSGSISSWPSGSYHNDVVNCMSFGIVYVTDAARTGALGGATGSTGDISNNYWD